MIASDLILQSYYLSQYKDSNETLQGYEASAGLFLLNMIIDGWSNEGLYIPTYSILTIAITENVFSYVATPPVDEFMEGNIVDSNNVMSTLYPASLKEQASFNYQLGFGRPNKIFVQNLDSGNPPFSTLFFYPTPSVNYTANLYVKTRLQEVDYSQSLSEFPAWFIKTLYYQLAKEISIQNSTVLSPRFDEEYEMIMRLSAAKCMRDMTVTVENPYASWRRYRPWNLYVG